MPSPSPPSLWHHSAAPAPSLTRLDSTQTSDVVIVGGGLTGLSAALHVAQSGRSVILLEAGELGYGGSGLNNGLVIPALTRPDPDDLVRRFGVERGERFARLVGTSASLVFELIRRYGIDCEAVQNGWLQPAHSPGRVTLLRNRVEQWQRLGFDDVGLLDAGAVAAETGSSSWHGALRAPTGGHINPLGFVRGLARAALAAGARIFTGSPAREIRASGSGWRMSTPQGSVEAGQVILATNAYTDGLWPRLARTIIPVRSYQMSTEPLPETERPALFATLPAISDTHGDLFFFHPLADGRLVTGGGLVCGHDWERRLRRRIEARITTVFPQVKTVRFDHVWHGRLAMTPEYLPRLHRLAPGVFSVLGYCGRGVALAVAMGPVLASALAGEQEEALALPFALLRPFPLHGVLSRAAPVLLLQRRWRDSRELPA